jgi:predicted ATPase
MPNADRRNDAASMGFVSVQEPGRAFACAVSATSLTRLWQQQGKRQEAYDLLALVYGWFTEGFDTAHLKEARTLLDQLA